MKKCIALSLLIMSSTFTHTMEDDSWRCFSSLRPYLPVWLSSFTHAMKRKASLPNFSLLRSYVPTWFSIAQVPSESKLVLDLRTNKSEFESQLPLNKEWELAQKYLYSTFFIDDMEDYPEIFLQYCYYLKFHNFRYLKKCFHAEFDTTLSWLDNQNEQWLLKQFQEVQLDGYSALGAAMLAKEASIKEKRIFIIQELINRDFNPTPKDIELAELILYDEIAENHKTLLHLLHPHSEINWSVLPDEIRKQITQYMLQLFKKEFWLLPEKSVNDL